MLHDLIPSTECVIC